MPGIGQATMLGGLDGGGKTKKKNSEMNQKREEGAL